MLAPRRCATNLFGDVIEDLEHPNKSVAVRACAATQRTDEVLCEKAVRRTKKHK
jgi:hypothetical protein